MRSSFVASLVAVGATFSSVLAAPSLPCDVGLFKAADGPCTATCPTSTFGDAKTGTCKSCYSSSYKSCSSARVTAATACIDGYFVKGGRCMAAANIPAGSYGAADGTIVNCGKGVLKCSAAGIESCKTGYSLSNGDCVACPPSSTECTSPTVATACFNNYFLSNGQCVQTCPASTFANAATSSCKACYAPSYAACKNARVTSATACVSGYYLTGGRCMPETSIPKGKYGKDGRIYSCPAGQASCTAAGPTSCKTGFSLSTDGKTCEAKSLCPAHSICDAAGKVTGCTPDSELVDGVCSYCGPHVTSCFKGNVLSCEEGHTSFSNQCWKSCPDGQHASDNTDAATCVPCSDPLAVNCFPNGDTKACSGDSWPDGTQPGRPCVTQCDVGDYISGVDHGSKSQWSCASCPPNSATCADYTGKPLTCKDGYALRADGAICIVKPACADHSVCDASGAVTSCTDSYRLVNGDGSCVSQCPTDSWLLNEAVCVPCSDPNADLCFADDSSLYCKQGFIISYDRSKTVRRCVDKCAEGQYNTGGYSKMCYWPDDPNALTAADVTGYPLTCKEGYQVSADGKSCIVKPACPDHAVCDASGTVTSCTDSYRLVNGACLAPCESGQYPYWRDGSCVTDCPVDSWLRNDSCEQCDPNATGCYLGYEMQCKAGWRAYGEDYEQECWQDGCAIGTHRTDRSDNSPCIPCSDPNADRCFPNDSSLYCKQGFIISYDRTKTIRRCVSSCAADQYKQGTYSSMCYYCEDVNALTCADQSGYPLNCKFGYQVSADGKSCAASDPAAPCPNAAACDSTGTAISCGVDWYLLNGECIRTCPLDKVTIHRELFLLSLSSDAPF
ncbi:hypothetical protein JCM6882_006643 [Rhodosporidiobolus microsporus]